MWICFVKYEFLYTRCGEKVDKVLRLILFKNVVIYPLCHKHINQKERKDRQLTDFWLEQKLLVVKKCLRDAELTDEKSLRCKAL